MSATILSATSTSVPTTSVSATSLSATSLSATSVSATSLSATSVRMLHQLPLTMPSSMSWRMHLCAPSDWMCSSESVAVPKVRSWQFIFVLGRIWWYWWLRNTRGWWLWSAWYW
uniref:Parcxpwnx06 n=1 Tax=Periplaneta americana TaxID=6978 RepID=Q5G5C0_PERAM|nr:Parcxpwnx06 [Periplaneta americana]